MRASTERPVLHRPDDTGAVAVLVAVLMSAVLLTVGALTVDLGSLWAARAGLRGVADRAALAAAALLPEDPTVDAQDPAVEGPVVAAAVKTLCEAGNQQPGWTTACDGGTTWAQDGNAADGEVTVERAPWSAYAGTVDHPGLDPGAKPDVRPWVVRVVTPAVRVTFGLARAAGLDHQDLQGSGAARRGLPYPVEAMAAGLGFPRGVTQFFRPSPYYLTVEDLEKNLANNTGSVCLRTTPLAATESVPASDCDTAARAGRGLVDAAALAGSTTPDVLGSVSRGMPVALHGFGSWPFPQPQPAQDQDCYGLLQTGSSDPLRRSNVVPAAPGTAATEANCVPLLAASTVSPADLTAAWLGTQGNPVGRLQQPQATSHCSSHADPLKDRSGWFDDTDLFVSSYGLISPDVDPAALRARIRAGRAANAALKGSITTKVFSCPRLLLLPVLDTHRPPAADGHYAVAGLTYFWVSDVTDYGRPDVFRGLITDGTNKVIGIRGWVIDPAYVQGADWIAPTTDLATALPMSVPKPALLVPTCDHPDAPCSP